MRGTTCSRCWRPGTTTAALFPGIISGGRCTSLIGVTTCKKTPMVCHLLIHVLRPENISIINQCLENCISGNFQDNFFLPSLLHRKILKYRHYIWYGYLKKSFKITKKFYVFPGFFFANFVTCGIKTDIQYTLCIQVSAFNMLQAYLKPQMIKTVHIF